MDSAACRLDFGNPRFQRIPRFPEGRPRLVRKSMSSRRRARSSLCRPMPHRSISPMPCIPKWATVRWARASTGVWCRSTPRSTTATPWNPDFKSDTAGPSRDWLSFVKSPKARKKIRQWFSKERRTEAIEEGRDELTRAMRKRNLPVNALLTTEASDRCGRRPQFPERRRCVRRHR